MNLHIETKRLLIRNFQKDDWEDVASYCTDAKVMKYIPMGVLSLDEAKEFVSSDPDEETECYAIYEKKLARVIGQIIYHPWFAESTWELGWIIHPHFQQQGYASEAARAVLAYGFQSQKLHRIVATCQPDNPPSWKVAEKIGMKREGHFRKCIPKGNNIWWDEYFYAILEEDYTFASDAPTPPGT
jgi:RimJ/RimL family protein N-acetyltransferase